MQRYVHTHFIPMMELINSSQQFLAFWIDQFSIDNFLLPSLFALWWTSFDQNGVEFKQISDKPTQHPRASGKYAFSLTLKIKSGGISAFMEEKLALKLGNAYDFTMSSHTKNDTSFMRWTVYEAESERERERFVCNNDALSNACQTKSK